MFVLTVTLTVKQQFIQPFIDATLINARNTRKEPGNLRFDVLQAEDPPTRFVLYEAYNTKEDHAQHHKTQHFLHWKQTVGDWIVDRQVTWHRPLFYGDGEV